MVSKRIKGKRKKFEQENTESKKWKIKKKQKV